MPTYTSGAARVSVDPTDATVALDSRRTRPFWFDGRFMAARDLEREQNYFLQREADLGQAPGFENMRGLMVDQRLPNGQFAGSGSIVIHAGDGLTPAGERVTVPQDVTVTLAQLPQQDDLGVQLTPTAAPAPAPQARSGLYVVALQPVEYCANLVTAYPITVQGPRTRHDSDIVQATAVSLVPYPNPPSNYAPSKLQAALARQIFLLGSAGQFPDSLLPLAVLSLDQGVVQWIDTYLVRRDTGGQTISVGFGFSDEVTQHAFLLQYDTQLQAAVASRQVGGLKANFAATDIFYALPGVGRIPIDAIDTGGFSQVFFPQEMDVRISIIPSDELPALLEEGLAMPPIDLTLSTSSSYADMTVFVLLPVPRDNFAALKNTLPLVTPGPILPQVLANRSPLQLLNLYKGSLMITPVPAISNSSWASAIGGQPYAYYVRWASATAPVVYKTPSAVVTVSSSLNPSAEGTAVTFTAQVLPAGGSPNVEFDDGSTKIGTATAAAGSATLTVSNLVVGTHNITAVVAATDDAHAAGRSAALAQVVVKALSTTALSSSASTATFGQPVTLTATVTPSSATGTVTFSGVSAAPALVKAGGVATATVSLPVGTYTVTASYGGDNQTGGSTSAPITLAVNKANATVSLTSPTTAVNVGAPVTFNAGVTPVTASGNVQFLNGAQVLGTGTLSGGAATGKATFPAAGTFNITAKYVGDQNFDAATSNSLAVTVSKLPTSVVVKPSVNPSDPQTPVTFTATVTPAGATGTVQFASDGTSFGNPTALSAAGTASVTNASLAPGQHSIIANYSGDATNAPSTSAPLAQTVKATSSVTLISKPNPSDPNTAVTFTATVTPSTLAGNVQFFEAGNTPRGTAPLSAGVANLPLTLPSGTHSITATSPSDANTAASTSAPVVQVVRTASSVTLSSLPNPSDPNAPVTYTATVSPSTASGNVDFLEGTSTTPRVSGALRTPSAGKATAMDATLSAGAHSITARYNGDNNNTTSTSAPITQTVRATSAVKLSSTPNPSTDTVTFTATVTPAGATGTVDFVDDKAGTLGSPTLNATGVATVSVPSTTVKSLAVGVHSVTASYSGDGKNTPGKSDPYIQTVQATTTKAPTTTKLTAPGKGIVGQSLTLTAQVTPASATGQVQFNDTVAGKTTTLAQPVNLSSTGNATLNSNLAVGTHSITAEYLGDGNNASSTSTPVQVVVESAG